MTLFLLCFSSLAKADIYFFQYEKTGFPGDYYQYSEQLKSSKKLIVLINAKEKSRKIFKMHDPNHYVKDDGSYKAKNILIPTKNYLLDSLGIDHDIPKSGNILTLNLYEIALNSNGFLSDFSLSNYLIEKKIMREYHLDLMDICYGELHCVFKDTVFDSFDYGNLLWGASVRWLGVPYMWAKMGSEVNEVLGSYGNFPSWKGDSPKDQEAIAIGYFQFYKYFYKDLDKDKSLKENFEAVINRD